MIYFCCDLLRRSAVRGSPLNGIDFVEVVDLEAPSEADRQRFLHVHLLNDPGALVFGVDEVRIEGGERIRGIEVLDVQMGLGAQANVVVVELDRPGDFSPYRLRLVRGLADERPPLDFDPQLSAIEFSFKAECPTDFDCKPLHVCPPPDERPPLLDYLAKDYESFRRLMLDRMATLAPAWEERNPADLGVTLVELLAYVGDQISYAQDSAFAEGFLDRARSRVSVRRLARLVDYRMSEGVNARAYVQIRVSADVTPLVPGAPPVVPAGTAVTTRIAGQDATLPADPALIRRAAVFETMRPVEALFLAHQDMPFYTWSDRRCCLPKGATRATLAGHFPDLRVGETLIFEEVVGPRTGRPADADPTRRHPVRLVSVVFLGDGGGPLTDPLSGEQVTQIAWAEADALPFPLCLSAETDEEFGTIFIPVASVAQGNIVLADHGRTIVGEQLGPVPESGLDWAAEASAESCVRRRPREIPPRFLPTLSESPVTHAVTDDLTASATQALVQDPAGATPQVWLRSAPDLADWEARRDLLASGPFADEFVVEVENDGRAYLRFGDDLHGRRPEPGMTFSARYRVGLGRAGNVGADTLRHIVSPIPEIVDVRNPLPAVGGRDPETLEEVRQRAPHAFKRQERAVRRQDYADVAQRLPDVQRARATWRHTGSWLTVFLTIDRLGGGPVEPAFATGVRDFVERFRLAGRDLVVDPPRFVGLEIELLVCVEPRFFRSQVKRALLEVLSDRRLADGRLGLFHPDRFSFGDTVYLSPIVAAAQAVPGVESVTVTTFQRLGDPLSDGIDEGRLAFERLEIPRLDNDPNFPERGTLALEMAGGK